MAAAERKTVKPKNNPPTNHFEKLLEAPCTHHEGPVKHTLKDCNLMKKFLTGTLKKVPDMPKKLEEELNNDGSEYPREDDVVMMIFRGSPARPTRRREKLIWREVYNTEPATPSYLKWSEMPVMFDRVDHPDHVPQPGSYPLSKPHCSAKNGSTRS